jgi:hypothetical protein
MEGLRRVIEAALLSALTLYSAYLSIQVMASGEYRITGSGKSAAGAALINFIGDIAGAFAVAFFYIAFSALMAFLLYRRARKA